MEGELLSTQIRRGSECHINPPQGGREKPWESTNDAGNLREIQREGYKAI